MLRLGLPRLRGNQGPWLESLLGVSSTRGGERWNSSSVTRSSRKPKFAWPEGMVSPEDDFSEKPEYPEIDPETHQWNEHRRLRRKAELDWHKGLQEQPNPEAKTMYLNLKRQYGYIVHCLDEEYFDYDSQNFYKFITRTNVASENGLPDSYSGPDITEKANYFFDKVKEPLLDAVLFEMDGHRRQYENDLGVTKSAANLKKSRSIINQVNRVILSVLGNEVDHLKNSQVDYEPNIQAFWFSGGHAITKIGLGNRKGSMNAPLKHKRYIGKENDPVERNLSFKSSALLQIRTEHPLQNIADISDGLCQKSENIIDHFPYEMSTYRIFKAYKYASVIPGTWTGDGHDNSYLSFHPRHHLLHHTRAGNDLYELDNESALMSQASLTSFARLLSQALYHGFDQFSSLPYPFTTQTVLTDGVNYSFFAYQLNTLQLSQLYLDKNEKQNLCWGTRTMKILDDNDSRSLNSETVQTLLKFYLANTTAIPREQTKPYIKEPLSQFSDEIQREKIFYNYRDMMSQRYLTEDALLHKQMPEIYDWERIYKIDHPQRHMEPRRRFFELPAGYPGSRPYDEPYLVQDPRYKPKRLRAMEEEVAAKKEKERLEASRIAEKAKYTEIPADEYE